MLEQNLSSVCSLQPIFDHYGGTFVVVEAIAIVISIISSFLEARGNSCVNKCNRSTEYNMKYCHCEYWLEQHSIDLAPSNAGGREPPRRAADAHVTHVRPPVHAGPRL